MGNITCEYIQLNIYAHKIIFIGAIDDLSKSIPNVPHVANVEVSGTNECIRKIINILNFLSHILRTIIQITYCSLIDTNFINNF